MQVSAGKRLQGSQCGLQIKLTGEESVDLNPSQVICVLAIMRQLHAFLDIFFFFCILLGKQTLKNPENKHNPNAKNGKKETKPFLILVMTSYDQNHTVKRRDILVKSVKMTE